MSSMNFCGTIDSNYCTSHEPVSHVPGMCVPVHVREVCTGKGRLGATKTSHSIPLCPSPWRQGLPLNLMLVSLVASKPSNSVSTSHSSGVLCCILIQPCPDPHFMLACVLAHVWRVCAPAYTLTWRQEVEVRNLCDRAHFPPYSLRLPDMTSLARQPALGTPSLPSQAGFKAGYHAYHTFK